MTHESAELFDLPPSEAGTDLADYLPLQAVKSLTGQTHIADASGATFLDRAFQLRGFPIRPDFKDRFDILAPQVVDRINRFESLTKAAAEARDALRTIQAMKLPAPAKKAVGVALMRLTEATKG